MSVCFFLGVLQLIGHCQFAVGLYVSRFLAGDLFSDLAHRRLQIPCSLYRISGLDNGWNRSMDSLGLLLFINLWMNAKLYLFLLILHINGT